MKKLAILAALLALAACSVPPADDDAGAPSWVTFDKNTAYRIGERRDGFTLTITHERYQFIPDSAAVLAECRATLLVLANDTADKRGREIVRLNEHRMLISMERNGLTGITSCQASVPASWASA